VLGLRTDPRPDPKSDPMGYAVLMFIKSNLMLVTMHGPTTPTLRLDGSKPLTIGRNEESDMPLPSGATVSREHAHLKRYDVQDGDMWKIHDNGSRHGTFLNGVKLKPEYGVAIRAGDMITIEPFTFQVVDMNDNLKYTQTQDDSRALDGVSITRIEKTMGGAGLAQERLAALLECSRAIHASETAETMAQALATAANAGTAFSNVAVVRPVGSDGRVELLAASGDIAEDGSLNLSQSLLSAAMEGEPVQFKKTEVVEEQAASILQYSIEEALCIPIKIGQSVVGCIYADNRDGQVGFGTVDDDIEFCTGLAEFAALAMSNLMRMDIERRHAEERQGLLLGTVAALVSAIDAKDTYTRGHSERVAWLSRALAEQIGLDADTLEEVHICGLVHDIGKIGIPEAVLRKPSKLTDEEFDIIKTHPAIGEKILKDVPQLRVALPGVRSHHERWDGNGYPDGTKEEETPLFGRILGVADAFDAMCSSRAYRQALDRNKVLGEITECAGKQFDPELAKSFSDIDFTTYDEMIARHTAQDSI
jgi:HD-GYP domain-containing protein (c-di-GMP phosphodiesterase class II)